MSKVTKATGKAPARKKAVEEEEVPKKAPRKINTKTIENSDDEKPKATRARKKPVQVAEDSEEDSKPKKAPARRAAAKKIVEDSDEEPVKTRKAPARKTAKKMIEDSDEEPAKPKRAPAKKPPPKKATKKIEESDDEEMEVVEKRIRGTRGRTGKKAAETVRERKGKCRPSSSDWCLELRTPQTGVLKQAFERLGSVASDCCLVFEKEDSRADYDDDENPEELDIGHKKKGKDIMKGKGKRSGGLKIVRLTEDKSVLIKMSLDAANFEHFYCEDPKITAGVDLGTLNSYIKTIDDDDAITIYMHRENRGSLFISTHSNDNREQTEIEINLMEIENPDLNPPRKEFDNMITMASDKFNNTCKKINNNSTVVEITAVGSSIDFRGHNEGGRMVRKYQDTSHSSKKKNDKVIHGVYELKNLLAFSKCNKLCNTVELYLLNDYPLVLIISVGTLGKMYVFMTPIEPHGN